MEKFYFESKAELFKWLFKKSAKVQNNTFYHRDFLAPYLGVEFLTEYEAGLCPAEEDTGKYAGETCINVGKQNHLPKSYPAVLVVNGVLDSYGEPMFNHMWVYEKDFK